jgi:hypothetical protein
MTKRTVRISLLGAITLLLVYYGDSLALDCPKAPEQISKDWEFEVNAAVAKIGPVKGGDLKTEAKRITQDLLGKLPDAGRIYLEQMMFSSYCSALRDDKTISETEKAQRLKVYINEVRSTIAKQPTSLPQATPKKPVRIDPKIARFGVTLGWQLGRYEFIFDSPLPEARSVSSSVEQDIRTLLEQDSFPRPVAGLDAQNLIHTVLLYYGSTNLEKHASILLGIAAMRASLVGASSNQANNEEIKRLANSAIQEIDSSVIREKDKLFQKLIQKRPANVSDVLKLLDQ